MKNNKNDIVLIDLFSGVGGFALALRRAGFNITHHYFSEIDKHAIAVYRYHFKDAVYVGAIEHVSGKEIRAKHPGARVIICFGWPCQDNSIAGKRRGHTEGSRSSLLLEAVRIIQEIQPDYFIAENVKGLYSVNGGVDFIEAIRLLSYLDSNLPQYYVEQQLLNTRWFLPQSRERAYFVGYPRKGGFRSIFPIKESDRANIHQEAKRNLRARVQSGEKGVVHKNGELESMQFSNCIDSSYHKGMDNHGQRTMVLCDSGQERESVAPKRSNTGCGHGNYIKQLNFSKESGGKQPYIQNRIFDKNGISPTVDGKAGVWSINSTKIRRLTETECERLQGFPDNWTKYGVFYEKPKRKDFLFEDDVVLREISATQRYKQMGNAVSVVVPQTIATKIINQL